MDQPQPTIDDVDGDGLPDLLVGTGCDFWYFRNQGSRTHPALSAGQPFLTVHELPVRLPAYHMNWGGPPPRPLIQLADYNADGVLDLITGDTGGDFLVHFGNTNHTDTIGPRVVRWYVPDGKASPVEWIRVILDEPLSTSSLFNTSNAVTLSSSNGTGADSGTHLGQRREVNRHPRRRAHLAHRDSGSAQPLSHGPVRQLDGPEPQRRPGRRPGRCLHVHHQRNPGLYEALAHPHHGGVHEHRAGGPACGR